MPKEFETRKTFINFPRKKSDCLLSNGLGAHNFLEPDILIAFSNNSSDIILIICSPVLTVYRGVGVGVKSLDDILIGLIGKLGAWHSGEIHELLEIVQKRADTLLAHCHA